MGRTFNNRNGDKKPKKNLKPAKKSKKRNPEIEEERVEDLDMPADWDNDDEWDDQDEGTLFDEEDDDY